ncbi:MAG: peroxiredoxin [Chloroflexi bacterium]|nr:peroxiredoxin [Chloroflexota bacterium]
MEKRESPPAVGETAPDFVLKDQDGKDVRLSELRGKLILLSFHPLAWTEVCARQMQGLEENWGVFESLGTVPLGLSVDTVPSKKAWADHLGIKSVRLLSDFWPHGGVAAAYGIFREKNGFSERANIIVDRKGKIAFVKVYEIRQLPDIAQIMSVLREL